LLDQGTLRTTIAKTIACVPLQAGLIATVLAAALFNGSALGQGAGSDNPPSRSRPQSLDATARPHARMIIETQPLGMTGWQPGPKITIKTHTLGMTGWQRDPMTVTTQTLGMAGWRREPMTVATPALGMTGWQRDPVVIATRALGLTGWASAPEQCSAPFLLDSAGEECICPPDLLPSGDGCVVAGTNLSSDLGVETQPPEICAAGKTCPFDAMLTNAGTGPFRGPIVVKINASIPGVRLSTSSSGWRCSDEACMDPSVTLAPGESRRLTVGVLVPRTAEPDVALRQCVELTAPEPGDAPVRFVQMMLATAGIDAGPADNQMGRKTLRAIETFRQSAGLAGGAGIDEPLIDALRDLAPADANRQNDRDCAEVPVTR